MPRSPSEETAIYLQRRRERVGPWGTMERKVTVSPRPGSCGAKHAVGQRSGDACVSPAQLRFAIRQGPLCGSASLGSVGLAGAALTARQRFPPMGGDGRRRGGELRPSPPGGWRSPRDFRRPAQHRAGKVPAQRTRNNRLGHLRSPLEPGSSYSLRQRDRSSQPSLNRGRCSRPHAYRDFSFDCSPRADTSVAISAAILESLGPVPPRRRWALVGRVDLVAVGR